MENALLTGLGLAAPAGLNAYLPLLVVALVDRFSGVLDLDRPYDFLSSNWGIAIITVLLTIEVVVDKIPGADHANDLIQSAIRPAAGAVLAMAATQDAAVNPVVAMVVGLVLAGGVHTAKTTARPAITLSTGGLGNPIASLVEDLVAVTAALAAVFVPLLAVVFILLLALFVVLTVRRLRRLRGRLFSRFASTDLRR